ncbi:hypothetical protein ADIS_2039 [Lunatimonas lonarensis]|uniref:Uncharacterized protein n=1 Tax=Lunatimonas lonarensis TaxID=1232681 RepID=R7ZU34_9BACT|nr:hypothetical protein ADIS_2039 [Lunatimonas lonarensis]
MFLTITHATFMNRIQGGERQPVRYPSEKMDRIGWDMESQIDNFAFN